MLRFGSRLASTAVEQLNTRNAHTAKDHKQTSKRKSCQLAATHTRLGRQFGLQSFELTAQRLTVSNDGGLRFTGRHQTLQVAQNGAGLGAGLLIELDQGFELFAGLGVLGGGQAQFRAAVQQALCDFLEGVQVLAQQEHSLGAHAFHGLKFVSRLADTLGQHHQLASGRNFSGRGVLLKFQRRHGFGDFQQVGRLAVDGAQSVTHLGQDLLLAHHHTGVALGAFHQGVDGIQIRLERLAQRLHTQFAVTRIQGAHVARQHARAFHHVREGLGATHQGLRHRLGQTLRLHQRLAGRSQLLRRPIGLLQHPEGNRTQHQHAHQQQGQQTALVACGRGPPQQGQGNQLFVRFRSRQLGGVTIRVPLNAVHGLCLVGVTQLRAIQGARGQDILPIVRRADGRACIRRSGFPVEQFSKLIDDGHGAALQKNSSTDAQECGMLGQDLQVQLLPACAAGIDIGGAEEAGRVFSRWLGRHKGVGSAQAREAVHQQGRVDIQRGIEGQQAGLGQGLLGAGCCRSQQARQIHNTYQTATQVGNAQKPALGVGHSLDGGPGENLPGLPQGQQVETPGGLDSQPG